MNEAKTKMTVLRFVGVWFLPIFFGWKVVKKSSGYSSGWRIWTSIWMGLFVFAVIGGILKDGKSKNVEGTSYMYVMPEKKEFS